MVKQAQSVKKGKDFSYDGNWDVVLSTGEKTQIFYDRASQTWYENKADAGPHTSHYSKVFGWTKQEILSRLEERSAAAAAAAAARPIRSASEVNRELQRQGKQERLVQGRGYC